MPAISSLVASTTTALLANGTWATDPASPISTGGAPSVVGTAFADAAGTLFVDQGPDGTFWDLTSSFPVSSNAGIGFNVSIVAPYMRIRYTNGATPQTVFRLYAYLQQDTTAYVFKGT